MQLSSFSFFSFSLMHFYDINIIFIIFSWPLEEYRWANQYFIFEGNRPSH